ncbi:hypothetical protein BGZ65_008699 [Modicella reniformis]|uniref:Uncharacterized protein n=1 Tax=Modicella reniformis TaxID=1440133 RepID=A0A9P6M216_9FUNG|nr:hypothetical protein BGZ65_008699 [Modicella reniformis]
MAGYSPQYPRSHGPIEMSSISPYNSNASSPLASPKLFALASTDGYASPSRILTDKLDLNPLCLEPKENNTSSASVLTNDSNSDEANGINDLEKEGRTTTSDKKTKKSGNKIKKVITQSLDTEMFKDLILISPPRKFSGSSGSSSKGHSKATTKGSFDSDTSMPSNLRHHATSTTTTSTSRLLRTRVRSPSVSVVEERLLNKDSQGYSVPLTIEAILVRYDHDSKSMPPKAASAPISISSDWSHHLAKEVESRRQQQELERSEKTLEANKGPISDNANRDLVNSSTAEALSESAVVPATVMESNASHNNVTML